MHPENFFEKNVGLLVLVTMIVTILGFYISPSMGFMLMLIGVIVSALAQSSHKKKIRQNLRQSLIDEANAYVDEINMAKSFPKVGSVLFLGKDERAILEEATTLFETRAVRQSRGGGVGFRVAKGVYIGGYSGQSESHGEWRAIDQGTLTLTNKKLVFRGSKENRTVPIEKILSSSNTLESFEIAIDGRAKNISFLVNNSYIWRITLFVLKSVDDPFKLNIKINGELT